MLIETAPLQHWLRHFYGYGSWEAKIWFVAFEDGGGDLPEEVAEKLNYFSREHGAVAEPTLCDMRELYRNSSIHWDGPKGDIFKTLYDFRFGSKAAISPVWRNLVAFAHAYRDKSVKDVLDYQKNHFGRNDEALIKLYPLPSPHNHSWYYSWLEMPSMPFLKSRDLYQAHTFPGRMGGILEQIAKHQPKLVLFYGMQNINGLKKSVSEFFPRAGFKISKAVRLKIPQYHRAEIGSTSLVITTQIPSLRHNRAETGFDWKEFGQILRASNP